MKTFLSNGIALVVSAALASAAAHIGAGNLTLTKCPYGGNSKNCRTVAEPEVVYPTKRFAPPGYANDVGYFAMDFDSEHRLTWDKEDDQPLNLTFELGDYIWKKGMQPLLPSFTVMLSPCYYRIPNGKLCKTEIRSERALNFTLYELVDDFTFRDGTAAHASRDEVQGQALRGTFNTIGFSVVDPASNVTFAVGMGNFYPMPFNLYGYVTGGFKEQRKRAEKDLNKKWRIGVGVGVGVGVPLLMMASYLLGKRKGGKQQPAAVKKNDVELN